MVKIQKVKDKENPKNSKRKADSYPQGSSHKTVSLLFNKNFEGQKGVTRNIQSDKKQGPTTKITLPSKAVIQN